MPYLIKFLILSIPFISLYASYPLIFPFVSGKNFAFRILVELATVFWLGLIIADKRYRLRNSLMLYLVLVFTFIVGLANVLGANPYNSLWSSYERMDGYLTILHLCMYFILIKCMFKTKADWLWLLNSFVLVSVLLGTYVLWEKTGFLENVKYYFEANDIRITVLLLPSDGRPVGTLGNPSYLGAYFVLAIVIKMILICNIKRLWLRLSYLPFICLDLLVIYFSATRGAMLGLMAGVVVFCLLLIQATPKTKSERRLRTSAFYFVIFALLMSNGLFIFRDAPIIKENQMISRISQISISDPTTQVRLKAWQLAWKGVKERPLLGWGQENFILVYSKYFNPDLFKLEKYFDKSHNIIIHWLISAGLLGLLAYLSLFGALFYKLRMPTRIGTFAVLSGIIAYFIQNLFIFDTINTYIIFYTLLAYKGEK